jgi:hypothetical protein
MLRYVTVDELARRGGGLDAKTMSEATQIVADVREEGESAVRRYGERFGELAARAGGATSGVSPARFGDARCAGTECGTDPVVCEGAACLSHEPRCGGGRRKSGTWGRAYGASGLLCAGWAISAAVVGADDGVHGAGRRRE